MAAKRDYRVRKVNTSGVLSRTPNPVPPVEIIQSTAFSLHQFLTVSLIRCSSSGRITEHTQSCPRCRTISWIVGPDLSAAVSTDAVSLTETVDSVRPQRPEVDRPPDL